MMSGTSLDGIDIALVRLKGSGKDTEIFPIEFKSYEMPQTWRKRIQQAFQATTEEICRINFDLGVFFGQQIKKFCSEVKLDLSSLDAIGFHGQTIYHVHNHSTLQTGEADVICQMLNTIVISDFRTADIAAGGSGAPLVPYLDNLLFRRCDKNIALQNLGGIGNITFLPKDPDEKILAFDTGPANAILNELVEIITNGQFSYDKDAFLSKKGRVNQGLLSELLEHDYFHKQLPKSTGREEFGKNYVQAVLLNHAEIDRLDLLRTFVSLISNSIALSCKEYLPQIDQLLLSGGGAFHPLIVQELKKHFGEKKVSRLKNVHGISVDSKEAIAFALLAHERLNDVPTNIPSVTGASRKTTLGKLSIPYFRGIE